MFEGDGKGKKVGWVGGGGGRGVGGMVGGFGGGGAVNCDGRDKNSPPS